MDNRIETLIAKEEIRELAQLYSRGVDRQDFALIRSLYTDDATDSHGAYYDGPVDGYVAFLEASLPHMHIGNHFVCNHLVSVDGDTGEGEVYAIAQGSVTINGFKAEGESAVVISGVPTTGRIASGGVVERETGFDLSAMPIVRLTLRNPDFTTAQRVAAAINQSYPNSAFAENGTVVATCRPRASVVTTTASPAPLMKGILVRV